MSMTANANDLYAMYLKNGGTLDRQAYDDEATKRQAAKRALARHKQEEARKAKWKDATAMAVDLAKTMGTVSIANMLIARGVPHPLGTTWNQENVRALLKRASATAMKDTKPASDK